MSILSRMFRLCKADLHGVMDQIEDKRLLLKQYLREMENALKQKQTRQSALNHTRRQIQNDLLQRRLELEKLEKELDLAIRKDKDDIAKMLIRKCRSLNACCEAMQNRQQRLEEEEAHLAKILDHQQLQYQALKAKAADSDREPALVSFGEASEMMFESHFSAIPAEEEIALELLQRKEALKQGGGA